MARGPRIPGGKHGYRKELKRQDAAERQALREERGDQGQLERLDRMFGEGKGAVRERARLVGETKPKRRRRKKKNA